MLTNSENQECHNKRRKKTFSDASANALPFPMKKILHLSHSNIFSLNGSQIGPMCMTNHGTICIMKTNYLFMDTTRFIFLSLIVLHLVLHFHWSEQIKSCKIKQDNWYQEDKWTWMERKWHIKLPKMWM